MLRGFCYSASLQGFVRVEQEKKENETITLGSLVKTFLGTPEKFSSASFLTGGLATANSKEPEFIIGGTCFTLSALLLSDVAHGENSVVAKHLEKIHLNPTKVASAIAMIGSSVIGLTSAMRGRWLTALPTLFFAPVNLMSIVHDGKSGNLLTDNMGLTHAVGSVLGSAAVIADGFATGLGSVKTAGFAFMTDALTRLAKETGLLASLNPSSASL